MPYKSKIFVPLIVFIMLSAFVQNSSAADFRNPLHQIKENGCSAENLSGKHLSSQLSADERLKICRAIDKIAFKLNSKVWSPVLSEELKNIWQIFSAENVTLRPMPRNVSSRILAMAEPFPSGKVGNRFEAIVYVRPEKSDDASFFLVLLHELRHVYDFQQAWQKKSSLAALEVERRAFLLMSRLTEESGFSSSGIPNFWKDSWRGLPANEIDAKRLKAIDKYLRKSKFYRQLAGSPNSFALDFSYQEDKLKKKEERSFDQKSGKDERLPVKPALPSTANVLTQNVREIDFNLEKPKNPRDEKEILRVALRNEKKIYFGMSNFVYDQKIEFQCWQKGKVFLSLMQTGKVAHTTEGQTLLQTPAEILKIPCAVDSRNLKTDFGETFRVSPALEKMPIKFVGFVEEEGRTLARYTVFEPNTQLFSQMAAEYPHIKPFRVFIGTIFIVPEDGQIVRFWGTSYPEDTITGRNRQSEKQKVGGSYNVTAKRQKLDVDGGLWVTVYVGTSAVAQLGGNSKPFSYTVKFENYRQSQTDVKILEEETSEASITGGY